MSPLSRAGLKGRAFGPLCAGIAIALGMVASSAAARTSKASDAAATHAFLKAEYVTDRELLSNAPQGLATVKALVPKIESECPGVLASVPMPEAGKPTGQSVTEIGEEIDEVIVHEFERSDEAADAHFELVTHGLRWGDRTLTRIAHAIAAVRVAELKVIPPNLCAGLKEWVASAYQLGPYSTKQYLSELERAARPTQVEFEKNPDPAKALARRLYPYEDATDKMLVDEIKTTESEGERLLEAGLLTAAEAVEKALVSSSPAGA